MSDSLDSMDYSPSGSFHGTSQARTLEKVAIPTPEDLPKPGIKPTSAAPALQADSLPPRKPDVGIV